MSLNALTIGFESSKNVDAAVLKEGEKGGECYDAFGFRYIVSIVVVCVLLVFLLLCVRFIIVIISVK